jgi:hypothetical protein
MSKYNEYFIEDLSYSNFDIKKLGIYGGYIFDKNEIIKKMRSAIKEFLTSNKDVDYLVAYYYPTYEDMNNNIALCYLKLNRDIKNIDLTDEKFYQKILWNEYYDILSDSKKVKILSYYNLLNEASEMLQVVEESYFILYELWMTINYKNLSDLDDLHESLERWLIRAEHINKFCWELKPIVDYNFMYLIRHMNNIFYYCCIPDHSEGVKGENKRQRIFNNEIANAMDKFEVIHQQLKNFIEKNPVKKKHGNNILNFSKKNLKKIKEVKKYEKNYDSR